MNSHFVNWGLDLPAQVAESARTESWDVREFMSSVFPITEALYRAHVGWLGEQACHLGFRVSASPRLTP